MKSSKGFTLVELMIALGVGSVALLATTSLTLNLQKTMLSAQSLSDWNELDNLIALRLRVPETPSSPSGCTDLLAATSAMTVQMWAPDVTSGPTNKSLDISSQGIKLGPSTILKKDSMYGTGLKISDLKLTWTSGAATTQPNTYFMALSISADKIANRNIGSATLTKTYGLSFFSDRTSPSCNVPQKKSVVGPFFVIAQQAPYHCRASTGVELKGCLTGTNPFDPTGPTFSTGQTALIKQGIYTDVEDVSLLSNVRVLGEPGTVLQNSNNNPIVVVQDKSSIEGITFDLSNNTNAGSVAVKLQGNDTRISKCIFKSTSTSTGHGAIWTDQAGGIHVRINGNTIGTKGVPFISTNTVSGITVAGGAVANLDIIENDINVSGNIIGASTAQTSAIDIDSSAAVDTIRISGNSLSGFNGVTLGMSEPEKNRAVIVSNNSISVTGGGVSFTSKPSSRASVSGNVVSCDPKTSFEGIRVSTNSFAQAGAPALFHNTLHNCRTGISSGASLTMAIGNSVDFNNVSSEDTTGIYVNNDGIIAHNQIKRAQSGIYLLKPSAGSVVAFNEVFNLAETGASAAISRAAAGNNPTCGWPTGVGIYRSVALCVQQLTAGVVVSQNVFTNYNYGIREASVPTVLTWAGKLKFNQNIVTTGTSRRSQQDNSIVYFSSAADSL
ncbi:prepilin-type N-terminal cleavage/methylation domain-containing protein [Bdellovibrionota bacterium FG-2]